MRLRAFDINEPIPELNEPHAIAIVQPWIDASNVGSLTLSRLESHLDSMELAKLAKPGTFFDLTRYRPVLHQKEDKREAHVPNTIVTYVRRGEKDHDFLFLRLLEPHMFSEAYIDSIIQLLRAFNVKRYCLLGAMQDMVPYTRPLLVTGSASNLGLQKELEAANVIPSEYQGPTTILHLVFQQALDIGIETLSLIVHLPVYPMIENDYRGETRLIEILCSLYGFPVFQEDVEKTKEQENHVRQIAEKMIEQEPQYKLILSQMEASYDARVKRENDDLRLSPEVEKFLQDLGRRFGQD
ncbi:PAC2 family protein [Chloroflexota bacterium]